MRVFLWSVLILASLLFYVRGLDVEDDLDIEPNDASEIEENEEEEFEVEASPTRGSLDVETSILFVKPSMTVDDPIELPAGKSVEVLVGFHNKGDKVLSLAVLDGSLRYPMDYNYFMQNFSSLTLHDYDVAPGEQGSILYEFVPAEAFGSRSFGLAIGLLYHDQDGNPYAGSVFNKTVPIVEVDDGLDGETFFLYVFLAGLLVLVGIAAQQFFVWGKRKAIAGKGSSSRNETAPKVKTRTFSVETGTKSSDDEVDFDWLPRETLAVMRNNPKKQSKAKGRKSRKNGGNDGSKST